jgi:hypothetical protein
LYNFEVITSVDENAREMRRLIDDRRKKIEITTDNNFVVCLEALSQNEILYLGSGVIIEKNSQHAVLTAGHCVSNRESGDVTMNDCIRIFFPTIPEYNTDKNIFARFKRKDPRFKNIIVNAIDFCVYPWYVNDGHSRSGTDIGKIVC